VGDGMTLTVEKQSVKQGSGYSRVKRVVADELADYGVL
jgi:hypothetical protein